MKFKALYFILCFLGILQLAQSAHADNTVYSFSVVPQQSAKKTIETWGALIEYISEKSGVKLRIQTDKDIPQFEQHLKQESYDFSYMNPYHYTVFHDTSGYNAIVKAKNKKIKGIVVVRRDSPIKSLKELNGKELAFPSETAFAASILPRAFMSQQGIIITPKYVASHDAVYKNIENKGVVAGGGVKRTYKVLDKAFSSKLRILWTTKAYTPHAIAVHKRVPADVVARVKLALKTLQATPSGRQLLKSIKLKGFVSANNSDWDDVRALNIGKMK